MSNRLRLAVLLLSSLPVVGQISYQRHIFFDNSQTPDRYYYSEGEAFGPSTLALDKGSLPVDRTNFFTPPNALRLQWKSMAGGRWDAEIRLDRWRNQETLLEGDHLIFHCYSNEGIPAAQLPRVQLSDPNGAFTDEVSLGKFISGIPAKQWVQVAIPFRAFTSTSTPLFDPQRLHTIAFLQDQADGLQHTLSLDEIRVDRVRPLSRKTMSRKTTLKAPEGLQARGYERHIDLSWEPDSNPALERWIIFRSSDGVNFKPIGIEEPYFHRYEDFTGETNEKFTYKVAAGDANYGLSKLSEPASASTRAMSDDEILSMVQEANFRYYWEGAHPVAGMALENIPGDENLVATGASGFGVMAILVGVERGFITRQQGLDRVTRIADFLDKAERFHGAWPHFMDGRTGKLIPLFGKYDDGGDLVETAFLVQGLLAARGYFNADTQPERDLRVKLSHLWETVEWDWYRQSPDNSYLYWHWSPDYAWHIAHRLIGFNETMIVYLLAIASPTHSVPASLYYSGFAGHLPEALEYRRAWGGSDEGSLYTNGTSYYDIKLSVGVNAGGPLYFTQYSFFGLNPHSFQDRFTNYFDNNRSIALINLAFCVANPNHFPGYGDQAWGLTASDDPWGYSAHEPIPLRDNGTITPTGALASFPYTPNESMAALRNYYRTLGPELWGVYGFHDAFNLKQDWFSRVFLGLNQAPITIMIENYRSGAVWKAFMSNPEIQPALDRIGSEKDVK
jgi:hypothetical protein